MTKQKKTLTENFKSLEKDLWCIDCLIRMLKEIMFVGSREMHEGDAMTISEVLVEKSEKLLRKVENFKAELQ